MKKIKNWPDCSAYIYLIQDFLRNIPDSVLSSDMHGLWMEAVDTENRAHKIEVIKRFVNAHSGSWGWRCEYVPQHTYPILGNI